VAARRNTCGSPATLTRIEVEEPGSVLGCCGRRRRTAEREAGGKEGEGRRTGWRNRHRPRSRRGICATVAELPPSSSSRGGLSCIRRHRIEGDPSPPSRDSTLRSPPPQSYAAKHLRGGPAAGLRLCSTRRRRAAHPRLKPLLRSPPPHLKSLLRPPHLTPIAPPRQQLGWGVCWGPVEDLVALQRRWRRT
jgi:hypothetical protein